MIKGTIDKMKAAWRNSHLVTAFEKKVPKLSSSELNARMGKLPEFESINLRQLDENVRSELYGGSRERASRHIYS